MKLQTKLLSLVLAVAMMFSLAACSVSADKESDTTPMPSETPNLNAPENDSILPDGFVADPNVEDLCLATADIPGDFTLLTVNGLPVSARMYLYWLADGISTNESTYGLLPWDKAGELAKYVKEDALNATLVYTLVPKNTVEMGFDLTQTQIDEFDAMTDNTIESIGGEEAFVDALRKLGLDRETFLNINRMPYYYQQLLVGLSLDHPNDEDMTGYIESTGGVLGAKHILLLNIDMTTRQPLADDVIAQKKATAEDILKQLQESDNLAADFDALMREHSEDTGLASNPDGYTFVSGEMVPEFEDGTRALEIGQISGIIESSYGYHIILRQEPDLTDPSLLNKCLNWLVSDYIYTWISEAEVVLTDEYTNLDPRMFYEKFIAYQTAFYVDQNKES